MTTLDNIPDTFWVPGLNFRGQCYGRRVGIVCQNAHGAIEIWTTLDGVYASPLGEVVVHSPKLIDGWADDITIECSVLGGTCYTGNSAVAYQQHFLPLLQADDKVGVLRKLAEWHDSYFRPGGAA